MEQTSASKEALLKLRQEAKSEADKERLAKLFADRNAFDEAGLLSKLFFNWTEPILGFAKDNQLEIKQLGKVRHADSVEVQIAKLEAAWERQKMQRNNEHALSKAVFGAFKWEFYFATFWNFVITILQLCVPFLLKMIIEFIQVQDPDTTYGVMLLSSLMVSQGISFFIREHLTLY
jgi:hypothetical protein